MKTHTFIPLHRGQFLGEEPSTLPVHILLDGSEESTVALRTLYQDHDFTTPLIVKLAPSFAARVKADDGTYSKKTFFDNITGFHTWKSTHLYLPHIKITAESVRSEQPLQVGMSAEEINAFTYLCRCIYGLYLTISETLGLPPLLVDSLARASFYLDSASEEKSLEEIRSISGIPGITYNKILKMMEVEIKDSDGKIIDYYTFDPVLLNKIFGDTILPRMAKLKYRVIQYRINGCPMTVGGVAVTTFALERGMEYIEYTSGTTPEKDDMLDMAAALEYDPASHYFVTIASAEELRDFGRIAIRQSYLTDYALSETVTYSE